MKNYNNFINGLSKIIKYNSVKSEPHKDYPFGFEIENCLKETLNQAKSLGFKVSNNHYYGYADFISNNKNAKTIGILGHLDIVPAVKSEWKYDPFVLTTTDTHYYGRGVVDDKGPILACLYAASEIINNKSIEIKNNLRIIFGCDEESGCTCVDSYLKNNELLPDISFTPDGDFPCVYFEKQILQLTVKLPIINGFKNISGGTATNIVLSNLKTINKNNEIKNYIGAPAHGSKPEEGINAFIIFLKENLNNPDCYKLYSLLKETNGSGLGINISDDTGSLTMNIGIIETLNEYMTISLDLRMPKSANKDFIISKIKDSLECEIIHSSYNNSLYMDPNSFLIKTLNDKYNELTNTNSKPLAIGGGTYAKHFPNCIAFGPEFPGEEVTIHQANERIQISSFKKMYSIYLETLKKLLATHF